MYVKLAPGDLESPVDDLKNYSLVPLVVVSVARFYRLSGLWQHVWHSVNGGSVEVSTLTAHPTSIYQCQTMLFGKVDAFM